MLRRLVFVLFAVLMLVPAGLPTDASAAGSLKFWVTEFKLRQTLVADPESKDGAMKPAYELEIRGRAALYGADKVDFVWEVVEPTAWLPTLATCPGGRLSGIVDSSAKFEEDGRTITGKGKLEELQCRMILK